MIAGAQARGGKGLLMRSFFLRRGRVAMLAAAAMISSAGACMADTYPARPITLVVPLPSGGSTDPAARLIAGKMKAGLGVPIVARPQESKGSHGI
jgi:tripartite-type tricarboxylate transporter receptor subunit TctC